MEQRWQILGVLFLVRTIMGIQYQSVASLTAPLIDVLGIDYSRLGLLIGLYLSPGIVLAILGGLLGRQFGDKRMVIAGLGLMALGGLVMALSPSYPLAVIGRVVSGAGAVLFNVLLSKMTADWFTGREIVTAMAILVSSWPLGISLGLLVLGPLALATSWQTALLLPALLSLGGLALVAATYRPPPTSDRPRPSGGSNWALTRPELWLTSLAGLVWMLFNVGFASVPGFAPSFLVATGWSGSTAASLVSVMTWTTLIVAPLGGYVAEKLRRPNLTIVACLLGIGAVLWWLAGGYASFLLLLVLGAFFGLPAGLIVALPTEALQPKNRALGMGVFHTWYYAGMTSLMPMAGLSRDLTADAAAPLVFGTAMALLALVLFGAFRLSQRRWPHVS